MSTNHHYDVLIIGSGAAGLSLALRLGEHLKIAIVAKRELEETNNYYAQGGISAVLDSKDSVESHVEDTLNAGGGLCDEKTVQLVVEHGRELTHPVKRGLYEKSLTYFGNRYYMTIRNDRKGFVATSDDGLNFNDIKPWTFDDGTDLGSYNTQQKWVTHSDGLFLVYTRRGADNDHIVRHRAPLFIARVDTERLCVIRESERVAVQTIAQNERQGRTLCCNDPGYCASWWFSEPSEPSAKRLFLER